MSRDLTIASQRWVLKLGSSTLLAGTERISQPRLLDYVRVIHGLRQSGIDIVLVSSGAVAAGRTALGVPGNLHRSVPAKQMYAAVGQPQLMALYAQLFGHYQIHVAQILLTRADFEDRRRYLNARSTLNALLEQRVLPIINENDSVATEEIRVGDNDQLAALVAGVTEARKLLLLTDVDGLYARNPRQFPDAKRIDDFVAAEFPPELWEAAGGAGSSGGTGGMLTKLKAAQIARRGGSDVHIADGAQPEKLLDLARGEAFGTRIHALQAPREARKRYVMSGMQPHGRVSVDAGAAQALLRGSSLLAVGVKAVLGQFERGDAIEVIDTQAQAIARGLTRYGATDLRRICGQRSDQFEHLLGYSFGDELIHRNDLTLLERREVSE
jgi:glutamate 5-kinase